MKRRGEDPAPPPSFIAAHSRGRNKGQEMVGEPRYSTRSTGPAADVSLEDVFGAGMRGITAPKSASSPSHPNNSNGPEASSSSSSVHVVEKKAEESNGTKSNPLYTETKTEAHKRKARFAARNPFCQTKKRRQSGDGARAVLSRHSNAILKKYKSQRAAAASSSHSQGSISPAKTPSSGRASTVEPSNPDPHTPDPEPMLPEPQLLVVDKERLTKVLQSAVTKTQNWPLIPLQGLHATLTVQVSKYAGEWDRSGLPDALSALIAQAHLD